MDVPAGYGRDVFCLLAAAASCGGRDPVLADGDRCRRCRREGVRLFFVGLYTENFFIQSFLYFCFV